VGGRGAGEEESVGVVRDGGRIGKRVAIAKMRGTILATRCPGGAGH